MITDKVLDVYTEASRSLYKNSFHAFVKKAFEIVDPGARYKDNWHIQLLCAVLQEKTERFRDRNSQKNIVINVPPRSLKSIICTVAYPAWLWTWDPQLKVAGSSYSSTLSIEHNMMSRDIIESEWYRALWPHVRLASDQNEKSKFQNTAKGSRRAISTGGSFLGSGADIIVIDDPVNPLQAESEIEREKANTHYDRTLSTRLNDPDIGFFILVMQRLHVSDLTGHVLKQEPDKWESLCLPGEKTNGVKPKRLAEKYENGLLFPARFTATVLQRLKSSLGSYGYAGQILQQPAPEEGAIWSKWFIPIPENQVPIALESHGTDWDLAYTKKDLNSASAFVESGMLNGKMYITNAGWFHKEFPDLIKQMQLMKAPHYIEGKASGASAKQVFESHGVPAILVDPQNDKVARARNATPNAEAGMVCVREGLIDKMYHDENQGILAFPNGTHDDLADALAQAINRHFGKREFWVV